MRAISSSWGFVSPKVAKSLQLLQPSHLPSTPSGRREKLVPEFLRGVLRCTAIGAGEATGPALDHTHGVGEEGKACLTWPGHKVVLWNQRKSLVPPEAQRLQNRNQDCWAARNGWGGGHHVHDEAEGVTISLCYRIWGLLKPQGIITGFPASQ